MSFDTLLSRWKRGVMLALSGACSVAWAQTYSPNYPYQPPLPPPTGVQKVPPQYIPPPQAVPVPTQNRWVVCATEEEICRLRKPALVRYGANGHYVERIVNYSFFCTNDLFGDPAPKERKQCEIRTEARYNQSPNPNNPHNHRNDSYRY